MKYGLELKPIKIRLAERDMSVFKLARKIRVNVSTLYNHFKGRSTPNVRTLLTICNYLDLNPGVLFTEVKRKKRR